MDGCKTLRPSGRYGWHGRQSAACALWVSPALPRVLQTAFCLWVDLLPRLSVVQFEAVFDAVNIGAKPCNTSLLPEVVALHSDQHVPNAFEVFRVLIRAVFDMSYIFLNGFQDFVKQLVRDVLGHV